MLLGQGYRIPLGTVTDEYGLHIHMSPLLHIMEQWWSDD
jgi:hypothetical protein